MSGHSKWATTKRRKEIVDKKRSKIFTKLANEISVAAREGGGDLVANFKLRLAVDKARSENVPKENIERAIKRGTGEGGGGPIEEVIYEGFAPGNNPVIVKALTDNRNRTVAEVKQVFNKFGGILGSSGAVMWMFDKLGSITLLRQGFEGQGKFEDIELQLIEAGAEDIRQEDDEIVVYTKVEDLQKVKTAIEKSGIEVSDTDVEYVAKDTKKIEGAEAEKIENFFDALDDLDDVADVYTNLEI